MLDKLQIYISLFAALVVTVSSGLFEQLPLPQLFVRLVWVIIVFYCIGLVIRYYLKKNVFIEKEPDAEEQEQEQEQEQSQEQDGQTEEGTDNVDDHLK